MGWARSMAPQSTSPRLSHCRSAVAATVEAFGQLDVLANNAGVVDTGPIGEFSERQWDRIFDVNVKGIYLMTAAALSELRRSDDAAIVNTASIAGEDGRVEYERILRL